MESNCRQVFSFVHTAIFDNSDGVSRFLASSRHKSFKKVPGENWFFPSGSSNYCAYIMWYMSSVSSPSRSRSSSKPIVSSSIILVVIVATASLIVSSTASVDELETEFPVCLSSPLSSDSSV